jgi:hypothetical protein
MSPRSDSAAGVIGRKSGLRELHRAFHTLSDLRSGSQVAMQHAVFKFPELRNGKPPEPIRSRPREHGAAFLTMWDRFATVGNEGGGVRVSVVGCTTNDSCGGQLREDGYRRPSSVVSQ